MKKIISMLFISALVLIVAACGTNNTKEESKDQPVSGKAKKQEELTIKHELGETKVKKNPGKIVVFNFGALDTLDKMGVKVTALPQAIVPNYLEKYADKKYINVGGLKEPDFEKISEIQPDLIIISGRQAKLYDEFKKLGPTIYLDVDDTKYMQSFKENTKILGDIFDKQEFVEKELVKIENKVKELKKKASATGKKALAIIASEGQVSAYGPGSRFGIIYDEFGFAPADNKIEASTHGQDVSFEYVVEKNPDYLFVVDRGAVFGEQTPAKQVVENELVKKTNAYKDGNITYLDPNIWYLAGGGLISVEEMINEVEKSIK